MSSCFSQAKKWDGFKRLTYLAWPFAPSCRIGVSFHPVSRQLITKERNSSPKPRHTRTFCSPIQTGSPLPILSFESYFSCSWPPHLHYSPVPRVLSFLKACFFFPQLGPLCHYWITPRFLVCSHNSVITKSTINALHLTYSPWSSSRCLHQNFKENCSHTAKFGLISDSV